MKVLLDANLSYRLTKKVGSAFDSVVHVSRIGLGASPLDEAIFSWAKKNGITWIISKDTDFVQLLNQFGPPPKVVCLRVGNMSTNELAKLLLAYRQELASKEESLVVIQHD